ncbi:nicotinate phosphoribosyltransferase [Kitasatospora aureofaciens]|uniref:Nicotinate phosphoribosyltransferase n=1 Tax=Kitasatospora aureofaciens TaxID=1894 RepID=A0A1E7NFG7_KITAU|nr:nicotinate phosphoribosyltransferase [Kitasatospora aureofaciens]OEV39450.1 nicotinate phosphoribosyltransferase [Kitasatospora aureofaciens]
MSNALITDLYEVTMALSYLREGMTAPATFSLFVRKPPPERGFLVAAGLEPALDHLAGLRVDESDVAAFAEALDRPYADLEPLLGLRFTGELRAVPEGRIVLPGEPLLEVTAPLPEAQFVESYLLNQVCHQSAVASKAARCMLAADGRPVVDFSLRRTHGVPAAAQAARLGALVGFAGTSNVVAAHAYGLRAVGTMAHSYIEAFDDEAAAFRAFARAHPGPVTFLVDTYDTAAGVAVAADVLRESGLHEGCAVRLDSGDLGALAATARRILDGAGLPGVRITASGGLDEYGIDQLVRSGAPIDVFAVGTLVGVSADAPYLDAAYKLVEYDGRPMMKLSTGKVTAPGAKQVHRGPGLTDTIALRDEPAPPGTEPLLRTVVVGGKRTSPPSTLADARAAFEADLAQLPSAARRIRSPQLPSAAVSERLSRLTADVRQRIEDRVAALSRATGGRTESAGPVAGARGGGSAG